MCQEQVAQGCAAWGPVHDAAAPREALVAVHAGQPALVDVRGA